MEKKIIVSYKFDITHPTPYNVVATTLIKDDEITNFDLAISVLEQFRLKK